MKYLSGEFNKIERDIHGKFVYLFLDYDGTLSPIASAPDQAVFPEKAKEELSFIAKMKGIKVAIVTGRSLSDIKKMIGLKGIVYVANHGLQIDGPLSKFTYKASEISGIAMDKIRSSLQKKVSGIKGVLIEDKGMTISVHFRGTRDQDGALAIGILDDIVRRHVLQGHVKMTSGKKVFEIRPTGTWNKGTAVLWLLARQKVIEDRPVVPVYIGDDVTDEDAFKALKNEGITVRVGKDIMSAADYYLNDAEDVTGFLSWLKAL